MTRNEHSAKKPIFANGFLVPRGARLEVRGSGAGRHVRRVVAVFAMSSLFALIATPAFAKQARLLAGSFGASTSMPANPYPLKSAGSVAVDDSTHDFYVTDRVDARVEKFNAKGEFLLMFGKAVNKTKVKEVGSTEAEQNLCTTASGDECGVGENPPVGEHEFVAVDNSSGESKGDVYVTGSYGSVPGPYGPENTGRIEKFDSAGHLLSAWASGGRFDGSAVKAPADPVEGPFAEIEGLAVDASGNLWVQDRHNNTFEFRQDASFVTGWQFGGGEFALDLEDSLYSIAGNYIFKHDSGGHLIGQVAYSQQGSFRGLVVDPSGNSLYVGRAQESESFIERFDTSTCHPTVENEMLGPPCVPVETFGRGALHFVTGLAIDPSTPADSLYAVDAVGAQTQVEVFALEAVPDVSAAAPSNVTSTSATLVGTVNASGLPLSECFFEWGETTAYGNKAQCEAPDAAEVPVDSNDHAVHASIGGLQAGKTYHYRLVAANANDVNALTAEPSRSSDSAFGPPLIESESALGVAATSATLQAQVNPNDGDTRVQVEYGAEAGVYDQVTPRVDVGSGGSGEEFSFHLQDLVPDTLYHYRVVATNSLGMGAGADQTFTTQGAGVFSLPDDRAWELVSPPDKIGALLLGFYFNVGVIQASADGGALTYLASAPTELGAPGNSNLTQVLSTRTGAGENAWVSRDISTPRKVANGLGGGEEYRFFSTDLSLSIVHPQGPFDPSLSSEASEQTSFLHTNYVQGDPAAPCLDSCYRPLATGASGFANVPEGTEIDAKTSNSPDCAVTLCGPEFRGASSDGSHVVLNSQASLIEGAPPYSLYEWASGQLQLVSVLPDGEPAGSFPQLGVGGTLANQEIKAGAVSADGSRIVWTTGEEADRSLYVRDMANEETVELGGLGAVFQAASTDDSRIFFAAKGELFEYEAPLGGPLSAGHTSDLTPGGGVIRTVLGAAGDGSSIYFVATNVLTNTPSSRGEAAQAGEPNLYMENSGAIKLVAVLSSEDAPDWGGEGAGKMTTTRVSPDGRWLAFMSKQSLTGYDNRDVVSGVRDEEVFLYDASANGGVGGLVCASCDPSGARPHGLLDQAVRGKPRLVDEQGAWTYNPWLAANIPAWTSTLYQSRYLSDSGRLFFNSDDALVASDTNGTEDVYEYEPAGVGDCSSANALFSPVSGGCVDLISSGVAKEESAFLDASESGDDVFFLTTAQLSSLDKDSVPDVYDARVDGGFPAPQAPPACEGDACQSPVAAPNDPTPGSLTYQGPGNPMPLLTPSKTTKKKAPKCAKGKRLSHGKCVKSKPKKKAKKALSTAKGKRAANKRGGRS